MKIKKQKAISMITNTKFFFCLEFICWIIGYRIDYTNTEVVFSRLNRATDQIKKKKPIHLLHFLITVFIRGGKKFYTLLN